MNKYIINNNTLVLMDNGNNTTKIIEKYVVLIINENIFNIIDESCKYYGSSYKGRCKSTEYLMGIKIKVPIIISESKKIIFFPTMSLKNKNCIWFNLNSIDKYFSTTDLLLNVKLINGSNITINCSNYIFNNQYLKALRLKSILKKNC